VILVAVGTFIGGFDALVAAADGTAAGLGLDGFAQIGHSRFAPRHLAWARFLPPEELGKRIEAASVVVCHGGMGLIGDAMRAGKPILVVPRRGRPTRASPAGDQLALARRLAERYAIRVCEQLDDLPEMLAPMLADSLGHRRYDLGSDVPDLIAGFLAASEPQSRPTLSS
jgi:UDP-N-acetylglucosamine transferase subunit ALG13